MGMRPEVAEQLLEEHRPAINTKGSGIGVRNVHQRIQLTFGRQYGLTIQSEPDRGDAGAGSICRPWTRRSHGPIGRRRTRERPEKRDHPSWPFW